jgi:hypothetical protein
MRIAFVVALFATVAGAQTPDTSALKRPMDPENPTAFIVLHRSELHLADSQVTQLQNFGVQLAMRMRPLKDSLDEVRPAGARPQALPTTPMTPEQRDSILTTRRTTARLLGEMHDAGRSAREQAVAVLNPDQQKKLQSIQDQLSLEARLSHRPLINERGGPPGSASGAGTRPY